MEHFVGELVNNRAISYLFLCSALVLSFFIGPGTEGVGRAYTQTSRTASTLDDALAEAASELLGLDQSSIVMIPDDMPVGTPLEIVVPLDGIPHTLDLAPASVRAWDYVVWVEQVDGTFADVEPRPASTLRGVIADVPGGEVAAAITAEGFSARILLPDGSTYWIEPISGRVPGAGTGQHVVYRQDDVFPHGGTCVMLVPPMGLGAAEDANGAVAVSGLTMAELAIDVDHEFYSRFLGSPDPIAAVEAHVNEIINAVNVQYERDVTIRHVITTLIIRASGNPSRYNCADCNDAGRYLEQFRAEWRAVHTDVPRDMAQLFTGKNINGSTIGIAWLGGVCSTSLGYSVIQPTCCSSFACKTDLSAHELGHNWGADHCTCSGYTMNATLQCANRFHPTETIPEIDTFRRSRTCLDKGDELRRIIVSAPSATVPEGQSMQFTATADFTFGEDIDVTSEAIWSSSPPHAGVINATGLFRSFNVSGDVCTTVTAAYEFDGTLYTKDKIILVIDTDAPLAVVGGDPPRGAIDARQPSRPDGSFPTGWQSIDIGFSGDTCMMSQSDFQVTQLGGTVPAPGIRSLESPSARSVKINLTIPVRVAAWTTVTHINSGEHVSVGYLPGDVGGDGRVEPNDVDLLVDALRGAIAPLPIWSIDTDRSGMPAPGDILRAVDLLRGAAAYDEWDGRSLP